METLIAFFDRLFIWLPRCELIRSTHGGVKWVGDLCDSEAEPKVVELKPGLHWYLPLTTEIETIVTARRPLEVPTMSLLTKDGTSIIVAAAVVFRINSVVKALAEKNWDVDSTLVDITQSVIFRAIRSRTFADLLEDNEGLLDELAENTQAELRKFGVHIEKVLLKDFDKSKTYRVLGETANFVDPGDEDE